MSILNLPELSKLPKLLKEQQLKINKFDLEYRPKSYFYPESLETKILAQIKGQERKKAVSNFIRYNKRIPDGFLKDENLRINMGIKGRQLVEEKYSLQSNSTKFCKIIKGLLL